MAKYARFAHDGNETSWGELEDGKLLEVRDLFGAKERTGKVFSLESVKLLAPCDPPKILAVGRNYRSHLAGKPVPPNPELFFKPVTCLTGPDSEIIIPPDSINTHYEGELVLLIGKRLRNASREEAAAAIFGVTCGNDVSERYWQQGLLPEGVYKPELKDVQWWRAKGCDTFGAVGPWVATGLNPDNLLLETRLNGVTVQSGRTNDLIFNVPECLSFISRYLPIEAGDIVYTGTPGLTKQMKPGDVVEVELEGVGVLRNRIVGAQ